MDEGIDKGRIVVNGQVGNDIDRDAVLISKIVETVNLLDVLVSSQGLHDGVLQFGTSVCACCHGIDAHSHDDAVTSKHFLADAARQAVNLMGIHRVEDIDAAIQELRSQRFLLVNGPVPACAMNNRRVAFLFQKNTGLIELVEAR